MSNHSKAVLYLHGFASGPRSTKARYFAEHLEALGIETLVPDLNGDFSNMTITSQLAIAKESATKLTGKKVIAVGSSMGGLIATILSKEFDFVGLVLLAPGFGLTRRWPHFLGKDGMKQWQESGWFNFQHYGQGRELPLSYHFVEDLAKHKVAVSDPACLQINVPTLILHGKNDATVPIDNSRAIAQANPQVELIELDDGHELIESLPFIWQVFCLKCQI